MDELRMRTTCLLWQRVCLTHPSVTSPPLPGGSGLPSEQRKLHLRGLWYHDMVLFLFWGKVFRPQPLAWREYYLYFFVQ